MWKLRSVLTPPDRKGGLLVRFLLNLNLNPGCAA